MARLARYTFYFPATSLDINGRQQQTRFFFEVGLIAPSPPWMRSYYFLIDIQNNSSESVRSTGYITTQGTGVGWGERRP